ncbi:MAG TPA: ATP-binding protein [Candidatus Acidoferrales bacterium]|nr:ATP-binding protein [Candidatus Acidoferrales bacterium]
MRKRLLYGIAILLLVASTMYVVWQGSFHQRDFMPKPAQTLILWAVSTLIFVLMVTVGWILAREFIKLYVARRTNQPGSRIRTKLVIGAMLLSCVPVFFLVLWMYEVLSLNLTAWFTNPVDQQVKIYTGAARELAREMQSRLNAQAALLAAQPETGRALAGGSPSHDALVGFARQQKLDTAAILSPSGNPLDVYGPWPARAEEGRTVVGNQAVPGGSVVVAAAVPIDAAQDMAQIKQYSDQWAEILGERKSIRYLDLMLMVLITMFVLFVATWLARLLANRISVPITAILEAAGEVRRGNLKHRLQVRAEDELALLVNGFNQMTEALESSALELDRRSRFTEAILESIPTGVLSVGSDGSIQRVNPALSKIFPAEQVGRATRLEDLFSRDDTAEIKYLMKRARRTGAASQTLELHTASRKLHLSITVAALESKLTSGFVVVLEDTSELLRAQKAAAWHEVARRVAHEIKNPLTPIALSAERISRQLGRLEMPPGPARIIQECAATIGKSVESVKTLVDEFSQFARFPAAQLVRSDLNAVVSEALGIFEGRLEGIAIRTSLSGGLPPVNLDREQFRRAVVNLVDNAAEAMQDSLVKSLFIATQAGAAETVELVVADSGCGVSPDQKERLFLPYFSTKNRGTGLGLAIVSHIVAEHGGQIRVEDNQPVGARFTVELPILAESEASEPAGPAAVKA